VAAPSRRLSVIALLAVGAAGLTCYGAGRHSRFVPRFGDSFTQSRKTTECDQRNGEVERRVQVLLRRGAAKDHAVRDLVAGHVTLGEAAVRFRCIEKNLRLTGGSAPTRDERGEDERICRNIMGRAYCWVAENLPEATALVTARLEAELQQLRGPDGIVRLPDE